MLSRRPPPKRIRSRPTPTIADAFEAAVPSGDDHRGESVLAVCCRVGRAPFVPRGYTTADCYECCSAVWISPEIVAGARRRGMVVKAVCGDCVKGNGAGRPSSRIA